MHADADSLVTVKNGAPGDIPPGLGKPAKFDVFWHSLQKHLGHGGCSYIRVAVKRGGS
jgi:hypothetical protein